MDSALGKLECLDSSLRVARGHRVLLCDVVPHLDLLIQLLDQPGEFGGKYRELAGVETLCPPPLLPRQASDLTPPPPQEGAVTIRARYPVREEPPPPLPLLGHHMRLKQ